MKSSLVCLIISVLLATNINAQTSVSGKTTMSGFHPDSAQFIVAKDGSGNFKTVQEAINAVPDYRKKRTVIFIKNGVYQEKIIIAPSKQLISLIGESAEKTIITFGDWAQKKTILGEDTGTSGSATIFIYGRDFSATNITFRNSAGPVGQAVAVHVSSDRCVFLNCRFLGFQDTLYTYAENSRQYYKNCYIEGTTDFIFGWSTAVFDECTIHCLTDSYITAASTALTTKYGYLFYKCKITADPSVRKMYLGRPWRIYAKTVFRECAMGAFIHPEGWFNWNKPEAEQTAFYAEYKNYGAGADTSLRVKWSHQLTEEQAKEWTMEHVLSGDDNWNPVKGVLNEIVNFK
jgi:pectinesterase